MLTEDDNVSLAELAEMGFGVERGGRRLTITGSSGVSHGAHGFASRPASAPLGSSNSRPISWKPGQFAGFVGVGVGAGSGMSPTTSTVTTVPTPATVPKPSISSSSQQLHSVVSGVVQSSLIESQPQSGSAVSVTMEASMIIVTSLSQGPIVADPGVLEDLADESGGGKGDKPLKDIDKSESPQPARTESLPESISATSSTRRISIVGVPTTTESTIPIPGPIDTTTTAATTSTASDEKDKEQHTPTTGGSRAASAASRTAASKTRHASAGTTSSNMSHHNHHQHHHQGHGQGPTPPTTKRNSSLDVPATSRSSTTTSPTSHTMQQQQQHHHNQQQASKSQSQSQSQSIHGIASPSSPTPIPSTTKASIIRNIFSSLSSENLVTIVWVEEDVSRGGGMSTSGGSTTSFTTITSPTPTTTTAISSPVSVNVSTPTGGVSTQGQGYVTAISTPIAGSGGGINSGGSGNLATSPVGTLPTTTSATASSSQVYIIVQPASQATPGMYRIRIIYPTTSTTTTTTATTTTGGGSGSGGGGGNVGGSGNNPAGASSTNDEPYVPFGPLLDGMVISRHVLGVLIRTTALNAHMYIRGTKGSYRKPQAARRIQIEEICSRHKVNSSMAG
ncbi:Ral GTPase-activating protein subunit alpha-1 [Blyttiomyces sp. JEL0837]|nr:Ral GTPase-activating protein subunit alpha-1 [Blyttiomyces sp. JEL0837]